MGHSLRKTRVNVIDVTLQTKEFDYLSPREEIICRKDNNFDGIVLGIKAKGWNVYECSLMNGQHLKTLGDGEFSELILEK